jgi:REP element-mobilizing transposase RayT
MGMRDRQETVSPARGDIDRIQEERMPHKYSSLIIHAIFSTKGRRPVLTTTIKEELFAYMGGIIGRLKGQSMLVNGPKDHVHLLFVLPATLSLSEMMEKVKANSSKWANEHWPAIGFAWQIGHAGFCVSPLRIEEVRNYILNQEAHHRKLTYEQEVAPLLERHGVKFEKGDLQ